MVSVFGAEAAQILSSVRSNMSTSDYLAIKTLNGIPITPAESLKYLGILLDSTLSFKTHVPYLTQKLKVLPSLKEVSSTNRETVEGSTCLSVLDYGDILCCHTVLSILLQCVTVLYAFSTNDKFHFHHCYLSPGWMDFLTVKKK